MAWHGPRGDCGCCNIKPPPPPGPWCDENDCTPEGERQFSSVKAVALWDDSFELTYTRDFITTSGACVCAATNEYYVRSYSGMAIVNGTYDAAYIKSDAGVWVEADIATECGFWFFPWLEVDLAYTSTFTRTYYNACLPNVSQSSSATIPVWFNTYSGQFVRKVDAFPDILLGYPGLETPIIPIDFTTTWVPYACKPDDTGGTLLGSSGTEGQFFFLVAQRNASGTNGDPGFGPNTSIVTYDGQMGVIRPYLVQSAVPWGPTCILYNESVETDIDAFYLLTTPNQTCGLYSVPESRELEWNAFNRKHSILLNV